MEYINAELTKHLELDMPWEKFLNNSDTQRDERLYISVVVKAIENMGGKIGSLASSQKPKDIRDVTFPGAPCPVTYECKKTTNRFMLNDTIPKQSENYYYIMIHAKKRSIQIKHCEFLTSKNYKYNSNREHIENLKKLHEKTMLLIEKHVREGYMSYYEYGQLFKRTVEFPNGLKSRPRPNWSITMKCRE